MDWLAWSLGGAVVGYFVASLMCMGGRESDREDLELVILAAKHGAFHAFEGQQRTDVLNAVARVRFPR